MALRGEGGPGRATLTVLDTESQKTLGVIDVPNGGSGTTIFSRDGASLYLESDEGYVAWKFNRGTRSKIADYGPRPREYNFLDDNGWNGDRTIVIEYPHPQLGLMRPKGTKPGMDPGQVALAGNATFEIAVGQQAGFDQYGNAWFGKGRTWTRIDRGGKSTHLDSRPRYLAHDQMKDRGSMHLVGTQTLMTHRDGKAIISCIWLTDDRAKPFTRRVDGRVVQINQPYQAAVVFAGPDVADFGFLPGKDMVYVVSGFGNYLVPFKTGPIDSVHR